MKTKKVFFVRSLTFESNWGRVPLAHKFNQSIKKALKICKKSFLDS